MRHNLYKHLCYWSRLTVIATILLTCTIPASAQDDQIHLSNNLSNPASFPGGDRAFREFVKPFLVYPPAALQTQTGGYTGVSVVVEKDGSFSNVHVLHPIGAGCSDLLLDIVSRKMPRWHPAYLGGVPVRQEMTFVAHFHPLGQRITLFTPSSLLQYNYVPFPEGDETALKNINLTSVVSDAFWPRPVLQVPDVAVNAHVNASAVVQCTINKDGVFSGVELLHDPGYVCGVAALNFAFDAKYWRPHCYYDTCYERKQVLFIPFITDTVAFLKENRVWEETELPGWYNTDRYGSYELWPDTLPATGWIEVAYTIHPVDNITDIQYGASTHPEMRALAEKVMMKDNQYKFIKEVNLPYLLGAFRPARCRRYFFFRKEDNTFWMLKESPGVRPPPNPLRVYAPSEVNQPANHQYGAYGIQQIPYKKWRFQSDTRTKGLEGVVELQLTIGPYGLEKTKVLSSPGEACSEVATEMVQDEEWQPARINGFPVISTLNVSIPFVQRRPLLENGLPDTTANPLIVGSYRMRRELFEKNHEGLLQLRAVHKKWDSLNIPPAGYYDLMANTWHAQVKSSSEKAINKYFKKRLHTDTLPFNSNDLRIQKENAAIIDLIIEHVLEIEFPFVVKDTSAQYEELLAYSLHNGMNIGEIGAGSGVVSRLIGASYDSMTIYLNEVSSELVEYNRNCLKTHHYIRTSNHLEVVKGSRKSTGLEGKNLDLIYIRDSFHHFKKQKEMVASIDAALKPDGEIIVVETVLDDTKPGPEICPKALYRADILKAFEQQGFRLVEEKKLDNRDWVFRFRRL